MPIEHCLGVRRYRKIQRFFRHFNVTILCLLLTILVLRGTIGAGKFGTPEQDFINIRNHFHFHRQSQPVTNVSNHHGPKISNWDDERKTWLRKNPNTNTNSNIIIGQNKLRVLLITDPSLDHNINLSRSKINYCKLHGIDILNNLTSPLVNSETKTKLTLVRNLLISHPEIEFIWWMDNYTLFPNIPLEIPWTKYKDHNLVIIYDRGDQKEEERNQFGSFLLRNSQWALDIIDEWARIGRLTIEKNNNKVYVEKKSYHIKSNVSDSETLL